MKKQVPGSHLRHLVLLLASAPAVAQEVALDDVAHGELVLIGNTLGRDGDGGDRPGVNGSPTAWIRDENPNTPPRANNNWGDFTSNDWENNRSYTAYEGGGAQFAAPFFSGLVPATPSIRACSASALRSKRTKTPSPTTCRSRSTRRTGRAPKRPSWSPPTRSTTTAPTP